MMFTMHIDDINKNNRKRLLPPGPGTYEPMKTFGRVGEFKSFHGRLKYDRISYKRASETPGPFQYNKPDVLSQQLPNSLTTNSVGQPFGKAKDRFRIAPHLVVNPSPAAYSPRNNFKEEEVFKKSPRAAIGRNTLSVLDS